MRIRLLTVALVIGMGSALAQPGIQAEANLAILNGATSDLPVIQKDANVLKVSGRSDDKKTGGAAGLARAPAFSATEVGGHTGELLLATLILIAAIAVRRSRLGKRDA